MRAARGEQIRAWKKSATFKIYKPGRVSTVDLRLSWGNCGAWRGILRSSSIRAAPYQFSMPRHSRKRTVAVADNDLRTIHFLRYPLRIVHRVLPIGVPEPERSASGGLEKPVTAIARVWNDLKGAFFAHSVRLPLH